MLQLDEASQDNAAHRLEAGPGGPAVEEAADPDAGLDEVEQPGQAVVAASLAPIDRRPRTFAPVLGVRLDLVHGHRSGRTPGTFAHDGKFSPKKRSQLPWKMSSTACSE